MQSREIVARTSFVGFLFAVIAGSLLHFAFAASGGNTLVGAFTPVNESVWEHLKLLLFSAVAFSVVEFFVYGRNRPAFFAAKSLSVVIGLAAIVMLFYTYTGIAGRNYLAADIGIFIASVALTYYLTCVFMKCPALHSERANIIGINARNLKDLKVDVNKYSELAADLPADVIRVAESGVFGTVEVEDYGRAGADAVLVGEGVATADNHILAVERPVKAGAQVKTSETTPLSEHPGPYWGQFGGRYVPEALITALDELERVYTQAKADPKFHEEFMELQQRYVGRESPLTEAPRFAELLKEKTGITPRVFLKREDLNHTGAHKINNALGQALLVKRMGKTRVIAETGAGQHGVATATVCAMMGLKCRIYMGQVDARRQALNVARMRMLGAEVVEVTLGDRILKDAINEALRDWVTNVKDTHYLLGTVAGPHPFPAMVRDFQKIIGEEAKRQLKEWYGIDHPDAVCACVGGGSNAIGVMNAFLDDERVNLYGFEAGGNGPESGKHAIRFAPGTGELGMFQGAKSYLLENAEGQTLDTYSISAGLDYASVGPEHAWLKEIGRVNYSWATDEEAMNAFRDLSRSEGIIPAIESSHAVAGAYKACEDLKAKGYTSPVIIINVSGRGDKDMATAGKWFGYLTDEQAQALDVTGAHGTTVA